MGTHTSWKNLQDQLLGARGTPRRERFERGAERRRRAERIWQIVSAPLRSIPVVGSPVATFWYLVIMEGPRSVIDGMSFSFMGDFLWWGRPMTARYFESPWITCANRIWNYSKSAMRRLRAVP